MERNVFWKIIAGLVLGITLTFGVIVYTSNLTIPQNALTREFPHGSLAEKLFLGFLFVVAGLILWSVNRKRSSP